MPGCVCSIRTWTPVPVAGIQQLGQQMEEVPVPAAALQLVIDGLLGQHRKVGNPSPSFCACTQPLRPGTSLKACGVQVQVTAMSFLVERQQLQGHKLAAAEVLSGCDVAKRPGTHNQQTCVGLHLPRKRLRSGCLPEPSMYELLYSRMTACVMQVCSHDCSCPSVQHCCD